MDNWDVEEIREWMEQMPLNVATQRQRDVNEAQARVIQALDREFVARVRVQEALGCMVNAFKNEAVQPTEEFAWTEEAVRTVRRYAVALHHARVERAELKRCVSRAPAQQGLAREEGDERDDRSLNPENE
jgi:hypothetical protein